VLAASSDVAAAHLVIRWTARTSLVLFVLAYVARPACQLLPSPTTKTLLADGLIQEVPPPKDADSADARRRYYRITKAGRALAAAQTEQMAALVKLGRPFLKGTR